MRKAILPLLAVVFVLGPQTGASESELSGSLQLGTRRAHPTSAPGARDRVRPACTITGTSGRDVLRGTDGRDVICARAGNDDVRGRGGDDVLFLGRGRDHLDGGGGDDRIYGGPAWDWGDGGRGDDRILLQAGPDKLVYGSQGADLLVGGRGDDGCLHVAYDGPGDRVRGGPGRDNFNADPGDVIRSAENGPVDCEGV